MDQPNELESIIAHKLAECELVLRGGAGSECALNSALPIWYRALLDTPSGVERRPEEIERAFDSWIKYESTFPTPSEILNLVHQEMRRRPINGGA